MRWVKQIRDEWERIMIFFKDVVNVVKVDIESV